MPARLHGDRDEHGQQGFPVLRPGEVADDEDDGVAWYLQRGVDRDPGLARELQPGRAADVRCLDARRPDHHARGNLVAARDLQAAGADRLHLRVQHHLNAFALERSQSGLAEGRHKLHKHMGRRLYKHHPDLVCVEISIVLTKHQPDQLRNRPRHLDARRAPAGDHECQ